MQTSASPCRRDFVVEPNAFMGLFLGVRSTFSRAFWTTRSAIALETLNMDVLAVRRHLRSCDHRSWTPNTCMNVRPFGMFVCVRACVQACVCVCVSSEGDLNSELGRLVSQWGNHADVGRASVVGVHPVGLHADGVQYTTTNRAGGAKSIMGSRRQSRANMASPNLVIPRQQLPIGPHLETSNLGGLGRSGGSNCLTPLDRWCNISIWQSGKRGPIWTDCLRLPRHCCREHARAAWSTSAPIQTPPLYGAAQNKMLRLRVRWVSHGKANNGSKLKCHARPPTPTQSGKKKLHPALGPPSPCQVSFLSSPISAVRVLNGAATGRPDYPCGSS